MTIQLPQIIKQSERLLLEIEQAVKLFPRCHKYQTGTDLRAEAKQTALIARCAWFERQTRSEWTAQLVIAIERLKISLQLGKQLQAFSSFKQFEHLARLAEELSRQARGWHDQQNTKGQNSLPPNAAMKRATILSSQAASLGANL